MDILEKAKKFYIGEINDHIMYKTLADEEKDQYLKENLYKISEMELNHAQFWKSFIEKRGGKVPEVKPNKFKISVIKLIRKVFNPVVIVSFLELGEAGGAKEYFEFLRTENLEPEEYESLKNIILDELEHETFFEKEAENFGISNIRDFVLGMNDGLVEILGAVTGLSAVYLTNPMVVGVSGLIVGIAGSLSMGIGAYISVRSQRQVNEALKEKMEILFSIAPERAVEEFELKLEESGIPDEVAKEIAQKLGYNQEALKKLLIKETDEDEIKSGLFTGFAYLFGVMFPVLPYFFAPTSLVALPFSILFAGLALATVATVISVLSGISIKKKVMEMVFSAFGAAGISFIFGKIMQTLFGIDI